MAENSSKQPNLFGLKEYKPDKTLRNHTDPLAYEVRKLQMAIRAIDRGMYLSPGAFNIASYIQLLSKHTEKLKELQKTDYFKKRKKGEDDTETVVEEISEREEEEGIGENLSSGVDSRISAEDTFTTKGLR